MGDRKEVEKVKRRLWLFDALVWTVISYGTEVWGWREREKMEKVQEKYGRWVLRIEWEALGYMVREELKWDKLIIRAAKRAWDFEERLREGKGSGWARRCLKEVERRGITGESKSKWEKERRKFMEERVIRQSKVREKEKEQILGRIEWEEER